jgi:hypothetical protein
MYYIYIHAFVITRLYSFAEKTGVRVKIIGKKLCAFSCQAHFHSVKRVFAFLRRTVAACVLHNEFIGQPASTVFNQIVCTRALLTVYKKIDITAVQRYDRSSCWQSCACDFFSSRDFVFLPRQQPGQL